MHYSRWQRHGNPLHEPNSTERGRPKRRCQPGCTCGKHRGSQGRHFSKSRGYFVRTGVIHPLTGKGELSGNVYEHRLVLWDKLGCESLDCRHECHWCGRELTWATLKADHVDEDKTNNDPENLVPSCNGCNTYRGRRAS
ncbi:HNH endonuclease [Gordonia phage SCentae]|nr:HNH endonuclease [Gordonia phage SCentae]